jgi:hypothetical protein
MKYEGQHLSNDTALFIAGLAFAGLGWWLCASIAFIVAGIFVLASIK